METRNELYNLTFNCLIQVPTHQKDVIFCRIFGKMSSNRPRIDVILLQVLLVVSLVMQMLLNLSKCQQGAKKIAKLWQHTSALHLSCNDSEKGKSGPKGSMYGLWSRASRGFTDRFNYNMAPRCCGDELLLTCCFPGGEEALQSSCTSLLMWGYARSHIYMGYIAHTVLFIHPL